jgi:hypothetical protein
MVLPNLLRIIFGGLVLLLIAGIALSLRRRDDSRTRGLLAISQIALAMPLVICRNRGRLALTENNEREK